MFHHGLIRFLPALLLAALPALYCLSCSTGGLTEILCRLAGAPVAAGVMVCTAYLPWPIRYRLGIGGALGLFWFGSGLAEAVSFQHSGTTFDLKYLHHFALATLEVGASGTWGMVLGGGILLLAGTGYAILLAGQKEGTFRRSPMIFWGAGVVLMLLLSPLVPALQLLNQVRTSSAPQTVEITPDALAAAGIKAISTDRDHAAATPGKNLIWIYLESLEEHFFDEKRFPGLLPNLKRLRRDSIDFTAFRQARNADFTFGGIYASLTGSVLTSAHYAVSGSADGRNNSGYDPDLGSRLAGLPGVLQKAGYFQMLLVGSDPRFAGLDIFAYGAGYDQVFSALRVWRELGYRDFPNAIWGVRDRVLLGLGHVVSKQMAAKEKRPFHLSIVTVDAHHPDGFTEPGGPRYTGRGGEVPNLLHAIHAMDHWIGKFIRDLQETPYWKDTVVVFMTDHLAMRNSVWKELQDGRERKLVFFALNAGAPQKIRVPGKTFDAAPTVLSLLGVKHNVLFPLGEDLLGTPDPRRLQGDLPERETLLAGLLKQYSSQSLPPDFQVHVLQRPCPALVLGGRAIPLFTEWGFPAFPEQGECFAVQLSRERKILSARRFISMAALEGYLKDQPWECTSLVLTTGEKKELILLSGRPGAWQKQSVAVK